MGYSYIFYYDMSTMIIKTEIRKFKSKCYIKCKLNSFLDLKAILCKSKFVLNFKEV